MTDGPGTDAVARIRHALVTANRILARRGILDAFGHVSARHPEDPDSFLISRSRAPALVTESDIQRITLNGDVLGDDRRPYLERFIHAAVYAARPEVMSVVHSHAPALIPFSITPAALRPVVHVAGFLGAGIATFDIRDARGDETDLLISDLELGEHLASSMGSAPIALMRGHGCVVTAESVELAVFQSVYAEVNAAIQLQAGPLGPVTALTTAEAAAAAASNASQAGRAWEVWASEN